MLRPDQEYSEYTDRYINWNGLIEELKACINAVGGAAVVNRTQYEDSWRGVQLGLSQLRAQLQQFADSVNTNIGAAQALSSQKGLANGIASLDSIAKLTASQLPAIPTPTAEQVGAISVGEKGAVGGIATLGADGILTLSQRPESGGTANAIPTSEKGAPNGVATLGSGGIVPNTQLPPFEAPGTALALLTAHTSAPDPHAQYATDTDLTNHTGNTSNPHGTTAAQVGAIATSQRGVANGVASLGADSLLTAAQVRNPTTGGWIAATLLNGWTNFGNGFANAEYRLWSDGWVEMRGLVTRASAPSSATAILVLPVGYRPSGGLIYASNGLHLFAAMYLQSTGELMYQNGSTAYFSLVIPPFKVA